ncbi:hypothetical protein Y09_3360 [Brachybacterium sp. SW0106-09]|nr:hypothetical protein Y09_3360 [Brachybacterium sp. SW0106-09]
MTSIACQLDRGKGPSETPPQLCIECGKAGRVEEQWGGWSCPDVAAAAGSASGECGRRAAPTCDASDISSGSPGPMSNARSAGESSRERQRETGFREVALLTKQERSPRSARRESETRARRLLCVYRRWCHPRNCRVAVIVQSNRRTR